MAKAKAKTKNKLVDVALIDNGDIVISLDRNGHVLEGSFSLEKDDKHDNRDRVLTAKELDALAEKSKVMSKLEGLDAPSHDGYDNSINYHDDGSVSIGCQDFDAGTVARIHKASLSVRGKK